MTVYMLPCDSCEKKVDVGDSNPTLVFCGCDTKTVKVMFNDVDYHAFGDDVTWEEAEKDIKDPDWKPAETCGCRPLELCGICCPF